MIPFPKIERICKEEKNKRLNEGFPIFVEGLVSLVSTTEDEERRKIISDFVNKVHAPFPLVPDLYELNKQPIVDYVVNLEKRYRTLGIDIFHGTDSFWKFYGRILRELVFAVECGITNDLTFLDKAKRDSESVLIFKLHEYEYKKAEYG